MCIWYPRIQGFVAYIIQIWLIDGYYQFWIVAVNCEELKPIEIGYRQNCERWSAIWNIRVAAIVTLATDGHIDAWRYLQN